MIYGLPHVGNWEVAAPVSGNEKVPVVAVAENLPNRRITLVHEMRGRLRDRSSPWHRWHRGHEEARGCARCQQGRLSSPTRPEAAAWWRSSSSVRRPHFPGPGHPRLRTGALAPGRLLLRRRQRLPGGDWTRHPGADRGNPSRKGADDDQALAVEMESLIRAAPRQWHLVQPNWPSDREEPLRVGLVSPYDLSIPGGVQAQVLGLAVHLEAGAITPW